MKNLTFQIFLFFLSIILIIGKVQWNFGKDAHFSYIISILAPYQEEFLENSPVLIWYGSPSSVPHVMGEFGEVPVLSLWSSFSTVIYIMPTQSFQNHNCQGRDIPLHFRHFLRNIVFEAYPLLKYRKVFLFGDTIDRSGSHSCLLEIASNLAGEDNRDLFDLRILAISTPYILPSALFFGHRPMETGNNLNSWTMNRVDQPIRCNAPLSEAQFFMHDVVLRYSFNHSIHDFDPSQETFELFLSSISTHDTCYPSPSLPAFRTQFAQKQSFYPLPSLPIKWPSPSPFDSCPDDLPNEPLYSRLPSLISKGVSVAFLSSFGASSSPPMAITCSFYIGIYDSDALLLNPQSPLPSSSHHSDSISRFNSAPWISLPVSWSSESEEKTPPSNPSSPPNPGYIQNGYQSPLSSHINEGNLLTLVLPALRNLPSRWGLGRSPALSKRGAMELFSTLHDLARSSQQKTMVDDEIVEEGGVEYIDLIVGEELGEDFSV